MNSSTTRLVLSSALLAITASGLVSCAGGPSYAETEKSLPKVAPGKGRVFVYRPSSLGFGIRPKVKIDDQVVGTSEGKGFLYSDQTPGTHTVSTSTEWKHKTSVNVVAGQPSFVRCSVRPGVIAAHIIPKVVDRATGQREIQTCKLQKTR